MTATSMPTSAARVAATVAVRALTVRIPTVHDGRQAWVHAATDVDLDLSPGRVHALVGESGCGKSVLAAALVGLLPAGTRVRGRVTLAGVDVGDHLADPSARVWSGLRGRVVGSVAQSSATFLTGTRTVGAQLRETVRSLRGSRPPTELLDRVGLPPFVLDAYPHELSGGMAGRVAVAFALAGDPDVVLADEPTASLDPQLATHVLRLLRRCADDGAAVLLITHDLDRLIETGLADDLSVMYAGRIVEHGPADLVLDRPHHAYTSALLAALPRNGLHPIPGMPPSLVDLPDEASFADRPTGAP